MPLYINGYKPTLSKDELIESMENLYNIIDYEIDLLKTQLDHDQFSDMVTTAQSLKKFAQDAYNYDLNMKELKNGH